MSFCPAKEQYHSYCKWSISHLHVDMLSLYTPKYESTIGRFQKYASVRLSFTVPPLTCKNLSILQDECSGPAPSIPWGNSITSPVCRSHFTTNTEVKHLLHEYKAGLTKVLSPSQIYIMQKKQRLPVTYKICDITGTVIMKIISLHSE